tara:strand:+ start:1589 stop:2746 length:1158 start_codon:yes stop_codon:yes gene_type:complete
MVRVEIESVDLALAVGIFILKEGKTIKHCENDDDDTNIRIERIESRQEDGTRLACMPGLGSTRFAYDGKIYTFERTSTGPPVSASVSDRVAAMYECATLSGQNESDVRKFCELAIQNQENDIENHYQTFTWKAQHEYWKRASFSLNRNFESIIIEKKVMDLIQKDLNDFIALDTRAWYEKHCIPFRRGYLLHGPPGTGKTSLITAISSHLSRRLHRVSLVAPHLNDDSLLTAVNSAHSPAVLVFEDIDALFSHQREKLDQFNVTFSGLLNAIDGVCDSSKGLIFIFTTNHIERLDPALRRRGRVDMEIALGYVSYDMAFRTFLRFFPGKAADAKAFAHIVENTKQPLTMAQLQHHFILHRLSTAPEAVSKFLVPTTDDACSNIYA